MPELRMKLLGSPMIELDHKPVVLSSRKAIALLVYLAVSEQVAGRDSLATMFWPDQDQSRARAYLRNALWVLAQAGLEPWLDAGREAVALRPGARLDIAEFQENIAQTQQHGHAIEAACPECIPLLEKAVALQRGDFLAGFTLPDSPAFDEWQFYQADLLRKQLEASLERLARFYEGEGNWAAGIAHARRWVAADPLDEAAQRWLVRLYALSGNRSLALKQYEILRETLDKELGIEPDEESRQLYAEILKQRVQHAKKESGPASLAPAVTLERPKNNLPAELTRFIGREREIAEITAALAPRADSSSAARLLTLTGPGGCGKTRLAIQVARDLLADFADGVGLVEFAPLADAVLVPQAVATVLGVQEQSGVKIIDSLSDHLLLRNTLLVFDNCEHLVVACARLAETLLQACPGLRILATSRENFGIPGEAVWSVPPLSLPEPQPWSDPSSRQNALPVYKKSEAVQLFVVRAADALPVFALTEQNGAWVANVCRRLDGMPLAIELAAARVQTLSVQQIAGRLDDRFHLLTSGSRTAPTRQQTLEATLDWSFALLSETEQILLSRLSVFAGGWTLEAAEAVCAGHGVEAREVLDLLTQLANKSLVVVERVLGQETRYRLLETIRQYAREKLQAAGEAGAVQMQHCDWYMKLAGQAESELKGAEQSEWIERLERDQDNLRAALAWSLENDTAMALQLAEMLGRFWFMRGHHFGEGREWLERVLSRVDATGQAATCARVFRWLGTLAFFQGDLTAARSAYEQSLALSQELQDLDNMTEVSNYLADIAAFQGDAAAARNLLAQARSFATNSLRELDDQWKIASTINFLGEIARVEGDYAAARKSYEESLHIRQELGDQRGMGVCLINLGFVAHHDGDYQQAATFFEESLALFQKHGGQRGVIDCLMGLAGVAGSTGQPGRAAQLLGAMEALREAFHIGPTTAYADRVEYDRYMAIVHAQLDKASFAAAWEEGRTMTLEQAIACALLVLEIPLPAREVKAGFGGLTAREREAAALVAQGLSNREIAEAMTVGVKTAETYVTRILNKLGFDSRVQIAIWAIENGLVPPAQSPDS